MSFLAVEWALEHSPVSDPYERLILACMARRASNDGTDTYPSRRNLGKAALCDKSTVTRKLNDLERRGIIREGNQQAAVHIPEHKRPKVYDILIPLSYYSPQQLDSIQRERVDRGLPPLTAEMRPDISEAPERSTRADKGTKRPRKQGGGASSTPHETDTDSTGMPEFVGGASSTRVHTATEGGASSTPNKSSSKSVPLSPAPPSGEPQPLAPAEPSNEEREGEKKEKEPTQEQKAARVLEWWAEGAGAQVPPTMRSKLAEQLPGLLADYPTGQQVQVIAKFAGKNRWFDLARAAFHPECQQLLHRAGRATAPKDAGLCRRHPSTRADDCGLCRSDSAAGGDTSKPRRPARAPESLKGLLKNGRGHTPAQPATA